MCFIMKEEKLSIKRKLLNKYIILFENKRSDIEIKLFKNNIIKKRLLNSRIISIL